MKFKKIMRHYSYIARGELFLSGVEILAQRPGGRGSSLLRLQNHVLGKCVFA
jgi:hypothetical protein